MAEINNAKVIVDYADMQAIANAIRTRTNSTDGITITEMPTQIGGIVGGVELPELSSPAAANEIFLNKQTIDEDGNVLTGAFTIDSELATQDDLIAQIESALADKAVGGSGSSIETVIGTVKASGPIIPGMPLEGTVYYIDGNGAYCESNTIGTINVMKNSILYASSGDGVSVSGNATILSSNIGPEKTFYITGNFTIKV